VEFRILGPLEVRDGERVLPLGGVRRRAVLGILLLDANRIVSVDRLVDGVWGDSPPASVHASLQNHVSRLREQLVDRLLTRAPGYSLHVGPDELDLERFRRLVDEANGADAAVAAERLREALALWRGPPLADLVGAPAGLAAAHLGELRLAALEDRIEADLVLGRHAALLPELEALVRQEPYRERLRRQLILALYRSGRQADALEAYTAARRALVDQLGAEPGRELQELHRAVLRHDPSLDAPAGAAPAPVLPSRGEERKTVTVLAADVLPDSSPDDPEARRAALRERSAAAERELESHGASVQVLGGGRLLGVFGVPNGRDDDSLRAVRAALALREGAIATRVGLATGEVVTGDPFVAGAPVDQALGLRDAASRGEVLAETRTWRLVRHAVGASRREDWWAIDWVDPDPAALARRLDTPLVGRTRELEQVVDDLERAASEDRPHLVTLFGAPGVGKTRLAIECTHRLSGTATHVFARCRASAQESTYAPLQELLAGLAEGDLQRWIRDRLQPDADGAQLAAWLVAAVGADTEPGRPEETAWAARRLLGGLAHDRPLLLVLDDIHWAAPAFLDLVESLVELARAPVLVLCLARPDLVDVRPQWGGGRLSSSSVLLDALTDEEGDALLDRLARDGQLDAAARERILAVAEGNPLFIEQLLAAALEGHAGMPDSIQTLLAARLDRLDDRDRAVAQAAAVCGTSFTAEEVSALVEADPSPSLVTLVRRELVRPGEADDPGGAGWSFRHSLIRDVAYGSLTKRRRAELHERLAEHAIEHGRNADLAAGYHLERAVEARRETGEHGAAVDQLAARAAGHLTRAGVAAGEREDMTATASLLGRAIALLPPGAPERIEPLLRLAPAMVSRGEVAAAQEMLNEAYRIAFDLGDARLTALATLAARLVLLRTDDAVPPERVLDEIEDAVPVLEQARDYEGLALAEMLRFHALDQAGIPGSPARLPLALVYARRANARTLEHNVMGLICLTLHRGTVPVDEAIARATEMRDTSTSTYVRSSALGALALLRAMRGEFDEARALVEEDRRTLEELGLRQAEAAHSIAVSEVEAISGDDAAAERILRAGLAAVRAVGDEQSAKDVAWRLGLALVRQGRYDESEQFVRVAQRAENSGIWVEVWWRVVLARIEASRGDRARALKLIDEAGERMAAIDESGFHADALLEAAEALRITGNEDDAATLVAEAGRIAERLGYVVARRRAEEAQRALTT
jgi:DNA-binding SARP family transcriptional activator/tetratricopeptide (TPR) repeat protein